MFNFRIKIHVKFFQKYVISHLHLRKNSTTFAKNLLHSSFHGLIDSAHLFHKWVAYRLVASFVHNVSYYWIHWRWWCSPPNLYGKFRYYNRNHFKHLAIVFFHLCFLFLSLYFRYINQLFSNQKLSILFLNTSTENYNNQSKLFHDLSLVLINTAKSL